MNGQLFKFTDGGCRISRWIENVNGRHTLNSNDFVETKHSTRGLIHMTLSGLHYTELWSNQSNTLKLYKDIATKIRCPSGPSLLYLKYNQDSVLSPLLFNTILNFLASLKMQELLLADDMTLV